MRFGIVVHGPEVIDSGAAEEVIDRLQTVGEVHATLGGAMGLAAVLDAGMEDRIIIVPRQLVSDAVVSMDRSSDVVVLLNRAKSRESGIAFGRMVARRCLSELTRPLVQLDDGFAIVWNDGPWARWPASSKRCGWKCCPAPTSEKRRSTAGRSTASGRERTYGSTGR
jgi:hypothetical protein